MELLHETAAVELDGAMADLETARNLLVLETFNGKLHYFALARRERVDCVPRQGYGILVCPPRAFTR